MYLYLIGVPKRFSLKVREGDELQAQLDLKPSTEHLMQMGLGYNRKMQDGRNLFIHPLNKM